MTTELEENLTKGIFAFQLREKLTRFGIPETEAVTLTLQTEKGETLACVEVPTTIKKEHIRAGSLSLESFKQVVKDAFLNPAINTLGIQLAEANIQLIFSSPSSNIAVAGTCCCTFNGFCCCYC